jgi:hypothetical protein
MLYEQEPRKESAMSGVTPGHWRVYASSLRGSVLRYCGLIVTGLIACAAQPAIAQTTNFHASCGGSVMKQGGLKDDLSGQAGTPIACERLTLSRLANGRVLVQFSIPDGTILGFAGDGLDFKANPNFITLPLARVYLPQDEGKIAPADGFCFLDGQADLRVLKNVSCVARLESDTQRRLYQVNAIIAGAGEAVPPAADLALPP